MMKKPYAPDIDNPYPFPTPKPTGNGNNGGGKGNGPRMPDVLGPGGVKNLAIDMAEEFGGTTKAWKKDIREPYVYNFKYGKGGGGKGGGKSDPNGPGTGPNGTGGDNGGFDPSRPDHRMAQMQAMQGQMPMQRGFLPATQPMNQAPTSGIFAAQQQMQPMQGQRPNQAQQPQLPPEILAMMRARQMGR
jgi:hypothetical protein